MPRSIRLISLALTTAVIAGAPALGQVTESTFSATDIEIAQYAGGDLPPGRSALTAKIQVLLDRSGTSPGVVDGYRGGMSESALIAFERRAGLPMDGKMDPQVWQLLLPYAAAPQTMNYTITEEDAQGLVDEIPADYAKKAAMASMAYTSVAEKLGERFHMDEKFIAFLNPGIPLVPGSTIKVTVPARPFKAKIARIIVDKASKRVAVYDDNNEMIADYPATVGSDATPSPAGRHKVVTVALNPNYTYNPATNFKQGDNEKPLIVPPGPNGPVGSVWVDLTKPTYGIHGTPTPSQLFRNQSNGCVRLTNWDAQELAGMVVPGKTVVEFLEPGVTIADVTGPTPSTLQGDMVAAPAATAPQPQTILTARAPLPRPPHILQASIGAQPTSETAVLPGDATNAATTAVQSAAGIDGRGNSGPLPAGTPTQSLPRPTDGPVAPNEPIFENTSEEVISPVTPQPTPTVETDPLGKALSDALLNALPETTNVAPNSGRQE